MKKLFIFVISLFVCVGVFQTRVMADDEGPYIPALDNPPDEPTPVSDEDTYYGGLPKPYIIETNYYDINEFGKELPSSYLAADSTYKQIYPSYDSNFYGPGLGVQTRTDFAVSWAQAICGSVEYSYNYLHGCDPASSKATNMSEMHLAWFLYNNNGTSTTKTGEDVFGIGGSQVMSSLALANGIGFVTEDKFPVKSKGQYSNKDFSQYTNSANAYDPDFILDEAEWFTLKTEQDRNRLKDVLMKKGPVATAIHLSDNYLRGKRYLNNSNGLPIEETNTIERKADVFMSEQLAADLGETTDPNYGALIIGWDDDYSANSFNIDLVNTFNGTDKKVFNKDFTYFDTWNKPVYWKTNTPSRPEKNGAWIVKVDPNSTLYYYVSYEDASINKSIAVYFEASDIKEDLKTHQLDNNSGINYYEVNDNEALFYNVFKPQTKEYIDSIGIFTYQKDVHVELIIFAGDLEKTSFEEISEENFICIKRKYYIPNPGYHRFDFEGLIGSGHEYNNIDYAGYQDGNIYVILKYTTPEGTHVLIPVDGEAKNYGSFSQTLSNTPANTSILVTNKGNKDLVTLAGAPAKVKLFTVPVENQIVYHDVPEGVDNPNPTFYKTDGSTKGQLVDLVWEDHEFLGWFEDGNHSIQTLVTAGKDVGVLHLYPAFKQRIVLKYNDGKGNLKENIIHMNDYKDKLVSIPNIEIKSPEAGKEFAGWEFTDSENVEHTIELYDGSYFFKDAKLNGADIVLTPKFVKVSPKVITYTPQEIEEMIERLDDKDKKVIYVAPSNPQIISVAADELEEAVDEETVTKGDSNKAILWVEANEIKEKKDDNPSEENEEFKGFKEIFENIITNITKVCKIIDINLFAQEVGESEGTKVAELNKEIQMEYDLSGDENTELREAAEKGQLKISQMHNGEVIDIDPNLIHYDSNTKKLTFPVQKFSIFAFSVGTPTPADTPSGESETPTGGDTTSDTTPSGEDTSKSTDKKSTDTSTPNPDFKTPNTGIY